MKEKVLIIIKPDGIKRNLVGKIIDRFEKVDLRVSNIKMGKMKKNIARNFYKHVKKVSDAVYESLVNYISSSKLIFIIFEGKNAADKAKKITGATDPEKAKKGTIRRDFGKDSMKKADKEKRAVYNLVHVSDKDKVMKEIKFFFNIR